MTKLSRAYLWPTTGTVIRPKMDAVLEWRQMPMRRPAVASVLRTVAAEATNDLMRSNEWAAPYAWPTLMQSNRGAVLVVSSYLLPVIIALCLCYKN